MRAKVNFSSSIEVFHWGTIKNILALRPQSCLGNTTLPCRTYSLVNDIPTKNIYRDSMALGVAVIAKKTHNYRKDLLSWDINAADVINTAYPSP